MAQQGNRIDTIPILLTVEEAGELLRIGRTKAYALTREWRETNVQSGLPVVELGKILRVPRSALEQLIGADLSTIRVQEPRTDGSVDPSPTSTTRPHPKSRKPPIPQPDLFSSAPDSETT